VPTTPLDARGSTHLPAPRQDLADWARPVTAEGGFLVCSAGQKSRALFCVQVQTPTVARAFLRPGSTPTVHSNSRKRGGGGRPGGAVRIIRHRRARAQEGQLEVLVGGTAVRELGPGACFGEIGLLLLGTCTARALPAQPGGVAQRGAARRRGAGGAEGGR